MPATPTQNVQLHKVGVPPQKTTLTAAQAIALAHPSSSLDLYQVFNQSGKCVWKLDSTGTVTVNPSTFTSYALLGRHLGSSFATAFPDVAGAKQDIYQIHDGSKVIHHVDYQGNAFTP